jgi:uncharacterized protein (TIGR03437 family)
MACVETAAAQQLPQAVEVLQRLDQLFPKFTVKSLAVDPQGNIYVAGGVFVMPATPNLRAEVTPKIGILPPVCPEGTPDLLPDFVSIRIGTLGCSDVIVLKLDPTGQRVIYGTAVGGTKDDNATGIKADAAGNVYVLGGAGSENFPATSFQGTGLGLFVLKLNSSGQVVYNTLLSWVSQSAVFDIDSGGTVYFGGGVTSGKLPATSSAYRSTPKSPSTTEGFIAKLDPAGTTLRTATYMDPDVVGQLLVRRSGDILVASGNRIAALDSSLSQLRFSTTINVTPGGAINSLAVDTSENIYVTDTAQAPYVGDTLSRWKYAPDGQRLLATHTFQVSFPTAFAATTRSGTTYFFSRVALDFPTLYGTQPCESNLPDEIHPANHVLMAVVDANGDLQYATYFAGSPESAFTSSSDDRLYLTAALSPDTGPSWRGVLRIDPAEFPIAHASPGCLVHSATLQSSAIAPGTIMTIFGDHLGPAAGASFTIQDGHAPFTLAGTSITVDGMPAPLLYAQDNQLNFVAPFALRTDGARVPICVTANAASSCLYAPTITNAAAFYFVNNRVAAINQDGSINSPDHPAHAGSYVSLYFTGAGKLEGSTPDGGVAGLPVQQIVNANVTSNFRFSPGCESFCQTDVLFIGAVPTLIYGANVVILRLPQDVPANGLATVQVTLLTFAKKSFLSQMAGTLSVAP